MPPGVSAAMYGRSWESARRRLPSVERRTQVGFQRDSSQWVPTPSRSSSCSPSAVFGSVETHMSRQSGPQSSAAHLPRSSPSMVSASDAGASWRSILSTGYVGRPE